MIARGEVTPTQPVYVFDPVAKTVKVTLTLINLSFV